MTRHAEPQPLMTPAAAAAIARKAVAVAAQSDASIVEKMVEDGIEKYQSINKKSPFGDEGEAVYRASVKASIRAALREIAADHVTGESAKVIELRRG